MAITPPGPGDQFPAPICDAVKQAVESTLTSILGAKPALMPDSNPPACCSGVVGIISFLGDISWSYSLILPEATAKTLIHKFVGMEIPFDSPDMGDAVGELANVLAGDVVARLEARRFKAQMSLPAVARGHDVEMLAAGGSPTARLAFRTEQGNFWLKLSAAKSGAGTITRKPGT